MAKIETVTTITLTDEDIKLIKTPLPQSPCKGCSMGIGCCGCPEHTEYLKHLKPYEDNNILDIAKDVSTLIATKERIDALLKTYHKLWNEISSNIGEDVLIRVTKDNVMIKEKYHD